MKRWVCMLLCLMLFPMGLLAQEAQEDLPEKIESLISVARAEFDKHAWEKLPKNNEYTRWYYGDERKIGWCSVFQIWCMDQAGIPLFKKAEVEKGEAALPEDGIFALAEGKPGNVKLAYESQGRFVYGEEGGVPKPGYLVIYGVRGSTPYTHIAIIETVTPLGDDIYELTTIEGNINSCVRRYRYRYDATPKARNMNMKAIPENERPEDDAQFKLHNEKWYITGFCVTWGEGEVLAPKEEKK